MQNPIESAAANIRATIAALAAKLDAAFPSLHIEPMGGSIEDGARFYGEGRRRPDFVEQDDAEWRGNE